MHELSIMSGVIDLVSQSARDNNITMINKVKLVVGEHSNAVPDSLQMGFEMLKNTGPFTEDAVLEIETKRLRARCQECECEFHPKENYNFICPQCNYKKTDIIAGDRLYVDYYEGD